MSELIFELSRPGRRCATQMVPVADHAPAIPGRFLRKQPAVLPEVSELQAVRHYTRLSQRNFAVDTHFYPLGSCTMKYNPRAGNTLAMLAGFQGRHPDAPVSHSQGVLGCLFELQQYLISITGTAAASLAPMAGAQGEFAGVAMIRAYHAARGDTERTEILVPDAAHGTNPATAAMCGYQVVEVPTHSEGDVDLGALRARVGSRTAGIMLTNPSTLGVFERGILDIAGIIHEAGALLYYDGANLNAILGQARPGDMGFDVVHLNMHKTFATPHGGGGPGAGPVAVAERLRPYLPVPIVGYDGHEYRWLTEDDCPQTIGRLSAHAGNVGVLLRAYAYIRLLGCEGLERVGQYATLNANYMAARLRARGFDLAFPSRRASHEFIVTLRRQAHELGATAMDFAKRLLDYGYHAPTTYFPLLVPECLLIEPTETESKETLDGFIEAMCRIEQEARQEIEFLKAAPYTLPVRRLDDVKAARQLDLAWSADRAMEGEPLSPSATASD